MSWMKNVMDKACERVAYWDQYKRDLAVAQTRIHRITSLRSGTMDIPYINARFARPEGENDE